MRCLAQVLIEGASRGNAAQVTGKTCTMKRVFLPSVSKDGTKLRAGDYVACHVVGASATALLGQALCVTSLQGFVAAHGSTLPGKVQECRQWTDRGPQAQQATCA